LRVILIHRVKAQYNFGEESTELGFADLRKIGRILSPATTFGSRLRTAFGPTPPPKELRSAPPSRKRSQQAYTTLRFPKHFRTNTRASSPSKNCLTICPTPPRWVANSLLVGTSRCALTRCLVFSILCPLIPLEPVRPYKMLAF
jgi:hypothetical protein